MSILKSLIGAVIGLAFGIFLSIKYITPVIQGEEGILVCGILLLSIGVIGFKTGHKWEDYARK